MHSRSWSQYKYDPPSIVYRHPELSSVDGHGRTNPTISHQELQFAIVSLALCKLSLSAIAHHQHSRIFRNPCMLHCPSSYPTWQHSIEWISRQRMMWWNDDSVWQRIETRSGIYWLSDEIKSNRFKLQPMKYLLLLSCCCNWLFAHFN